jgi:hypothetical protein
LSALGTKFSLACTLLGGYTRLGVTAGIVPSRCPFPVSPDARIVRILAIGEKQRERLFVGGDEVRL